MLIIMLGSMSKCLYHHCSIISKEIDELSKITIDYNDKYKAVIYDWHKLQRHFLLHNVANFVFKK